MSKEDYIVEIPGDRKDRIENILFVENKEGYTVFYGEPSLVRRTLFYLADASWSGWYESVSGKKHFEHGLSGQRYTVCINDGLMSRAWSKALRHLELDGVEIQEVTPSIVDLLKVQYGN